VAVEAAYETRSDGTLATLMVNLLHEIWVEPDGTGQALESCCLAGPDGDEFRASLGPEARLIQSFWAGSHFEAMTIFNELRGREKYTTEHDWDYEPYPPDWRERQSLGSQPPA